METATSMTDMDGIYTTLTSIFQSVFDDETIVLSPQTTAADVQGWDSFNHIRLILAVQKAFKVKFSAAQTTNLKNVGEFAALISAKASRP